MLLLELYVHGYTVAEKLIFPNDVNESSHCFWYFTFHRCHRMYHSLLLCMYVLRVQCTCSNENLYFCIDYYDFS